MLTRARDPGAVILESMKTNLFGSDGNGVVE